MLKQVTSNGIEANAVELYMQECSSNSIDYEKFKGMFPEKTRFYRFLEVMDHFVIMSLRTYLGFELEPLTPEGERMKVALSVYNKAEANEYAQLTLDAETPQDYIRKGIERKLISGADFFQSLGADLGRLYSSNPNLRSYIKLQILPKWNRPKTNVFLESPSTICAMTMEHYGLAIEEVDEFRNDMGQLILDVMKRYVKGEIC
jgi:hypothetical protein